MTLEEAAALLDEARLQARPTAPPSKMMTLDLSAAYQVQRLLVERWRSRGEVPTGLKLVHPGPGAGGPGWPAEGAICGELVRTMERPSGDHAELARLVQPKLHAGLAFLLSGPETRSERSPLASYAVDAVACSLEISSSRVAGGEPSVSDNVADNAETGTYVLGRWHRWPMDVGNLGLLLERDGYIVATASTAAILGDPAKALIIAGRLASANSIELKGGAIVLVATATTPVLLDGPGILRAEVQGLGAC